MNGAALLLFVICYLLISYFLYGKFVSKIVGIDPNRKTPAYTKQDGLDYVPCHPLVLFGHHFASIAGAGPIVGPIVAAYFGWLPALLWLLVGCIFIGGVHDFLAMFISVRHEGKSIAYVIEKYLGLPGRQLFLLFCVLMGFLVIAIFAILIVNLFVQYPVVASASIIFIFMAPLFWAVKKVTKSLLVTSCIFVPLVFLVTYFSSYIPLDLEDFGISKANEANVWFLLLGIYVFLGSIVPVQILLQPRDYLSSYLLYALMILSLGGVFFYQPTLQMEMFTGFTDVLQQGGGKANLFPTLFILIACGACSGFHSLIASGTTSKQVQNEKDIQPIAYGGMVLETVLGVISIISVAYLGQSDFTQIAKNPVAAFAQGVGEFISACGIDKVHAVSFISLVVSVFMMTTIDTTTRLLRFLWQELFSPKSIDIETEDKEGYIDPEDLTKRDIMNVLEPKRKNLFFKIMQNPIVATISVLGFSSIFIFGNRDIWPIFGASNQLLSALTLLCISMYLWYKKINYFISLLPMVMMLVMSLWALIEMFGNYLSVNLPLTISCVFLIVLTFCLILLSINIIVKRTKEARLAK